jgi:hypothetical protein
MNQFKLASDLEHLLQNQTSADFGGVTFNRVYWNLEVKLKRFKWNLFVWR